MYNPTLSPTTPPATPTTPTTGAAGCCWCTTHKRNVSTSNSVYQTSTQIGNSTKKYHLTVDFVANQVLVTSVFQWGSVDPAITNSQRNQIISSFGSRVASVWSNKANMRITDTTCSPNSKTLPIRFQILWNTATSIAPHYSVNLVPGPARSNITGLVASIDMHDLNNRAYTLAHEYGHTIGLPDEYLYAARGVTSATVTFNRADGTSTRITLPQSGNLMSTSNNFSLLDRHFYFLEIEAQKLLRSSAGLSKGGLTCEII